MLSRGRVDPNYASGMGALRKLVGAKLEHPFLEQCGCYAKVRYRGLLRVRQEGEQYLAAMKTVGHGASVGNECPLSIMLDFLDNPSGGPNVSCIAGMEGPKFTVPELDVTLMPFTNDAFGFTGLVPEGWVEVAPGIYGKSALGETTIVQQSAPLIGIEGMLNLLQTQLGLDEALSLAGTREANNLTWSLYETEGRGLSLNIALTEHDGTTYIVVLSTPFDERGFYFSEVFLPAVDALLPDSG